MGASAAAVQAHVGLPPVLCYHRVGGPLELGVTRVPRAVFERQMRALARAGWETLTLEQFSDAVARRFAVARNRVLLTFDDGYAALADFAYPVLAGLGFTATTFLVTDYVGAWNTWDVRYTWRRLRHLDWRAIGDWRGPGVRFPAPRAARPRPPPPPDGPGRGPRLGSRRRLCASARGPAPRGPRPPILH